MDQKNFHKMIDPDGFAKRQSHRPEPTEEDLRRAAEQTAYWNKIAKHKAELSSVYRTRWKNYVLGTMRADYNHAANQPLFLEFIYFTAKEKSMRLGSWKNKDDVLVLRFEPKSRYLIQFDEVGGGEIIKQNHFRSAGGYADHPGSNSGDYFAHWHSGISMRLNAEELNNFMVQLVEHHRSKGIDLAVDLAKITRRIVLPSILAVAFLKSCTPVFGQELAPIDTAREQITLER